MKLFRIILCIVFIAVFFLVPGITQAQEGVKLTITPPLIKSNVNPGQIWRSTIKLVNNNAYDIEAYVEVSDFKGGGERGTVNFLPPAPKGEGEDYLLSRWIKIDAGPYPVSAQDSVDIPFTIVVPENAGPGGHYAAILAGTRPPKDKTEGAAIKVSTLLASLIMVDVEGGIEEKGSIREFSSDKGFYSEPRAQFTVRFQNDGNVHIQPRGEIRIFDFWDEEAGVLRLNHKSDFGNVLPGDIRKWTLDWSGENNFFSMGRYRAQLVLGFGNRGHETVDRALYFWVIYTKPLLIAIGSILLFVLLLVFFIRRYIKRAVMITQEQAGIVPLKAGKKKKIEVIHERSRGAGPKVKTAKPGVKKKKNVIKKNKAPIGFSWHKLKYIMLFVVVVLAIIALIIFYFGSWGSNKQAKKEIPKADNVEILDLDDFEAEEVEPVNADEEAGSDKTESDPEISGTEAATTSPDEKKEEARAVELDKKNISIKVLNGSGTAGLAGKAARVLEEAEFVVGETGNAITFNYENTLIRHRKDLRKLAGEISEILAVPAVIEEVKSQDEDIVVIVGLDY